MRKLISTLVAVVMAVTIASPVLAGDYHQNRDRNNEVAAGMLLGIIAGAIIGGAVANDRHYVNHRGGQRYGGWDRPRYRQRDHYDRGRYQDRPRYGGRDSTHYDRGGSGRGHYQVRPQCPDMRHYQGPIHYRNGCYHPGW